MSINFIKEYLELKKLKKDLMKTLNETSEKIEIIEGKCIEYMTSEGIQSINVDGSNVSLRSQYFAHYSKLDNAIHALQESELSWMLKLKIDDRTLSSHVRELIAKSEIESSENIENCIELPEELKKYINIHEKTTLSVRNN